MGIVYALEAGRKRVENYTALLPSRNSSYSYYPSCHEKRLRDVIPPRKLPSYTHGTVMSQRQVTYGH